MHICSEAQAHLSSTVYSQEVIDEHRYCALCVYVFLSNKAAYTSSGNPLIFVLFCVFVHTYFILNNTVNKVFHIFIKTSTDPYLKGPYSKITLNPGQEEKQGLGEEGERTSKEGEERKERERQGGTAKGEKAKGPWHSRHRRS